MRNYWVLIRNDAGTAIKVTVMGESPFYAYQNAKALYGKALISEHANVC